MAGPTIKQDMPPQGGYPKIQISKVIGWAPKTSTIIATFAVLIPLGLWDYKRKMAIAMRHLLEDDEGRTSLEPLLQAETDRLIMWQLRRNRDEENELMKDVPGWVTGTWFGEPVHKTNPNMEEWVLPSNLEVYAHNKERDMHKQMFFRHSLF